MRCILVSFVSPIDITFITIFPIISKIHKNHSKLSDSRLHNFACTKHNVASIKIAGAENVKRDKSPAYVKGIENSNSSRKLVERRQRQSVWRLSSDYSFAPFLLSFSLAIVTISCRLNRISKQFITPTPRGASTRLSTIARCSLRTIASSIRAFKE